jgi:hypothetical protein
MVARLALVMCSKIATKALLLSRIGRPSDGSSRYRWNSAIAAARNTKGLVFQATPEAQ